MRSSFLNVARHPARHQISVNRAGPHTTGTGKGTGSAYITFKRSSDAERCIKAVDGVAWAGGLAESRSTWDGALIITWTEGQAGDREW